jgi:hypothetical protein
MATINEVNADKAIYSSLDFDTKYSFDRLNMINYTEPHRITNALNIFKDMHKINIKSTIDGIFNDFNFSKHKMCIAGGFYNQHMHRYTTTFDVFAFDKIEPLLEHLKPKILYVSLDCISFNTSCGREINIILKYKSSNPIELMSKFDISACEVWYDGELHFTARAKFTFETNILLLNSASEHRIRKYMMFGYSVNELPPSMKTQDLPEGMRYRVLNPNYLDSAWFKNDSFNIKNLVSGNYNKLVGLLKYENFMAQIKTGVVKFEPSFPPLRYNRYLLHDLVQSLNNEKLFNEGDKKAVLYAVVDEILDSSFKFNDAVDKIQASALNRYPTIINKIIF